MSVPPPNSTVRRRSASYAMAVPLRTLGPAAESFIHDPFHIHVDALFCAVPPSKSNTPPPEPSAVTG